MCLLQFILMLSPVMYRASILQPPDIKSHTSAVVDMIIDQFWNYDMFVYYRNSTYPELNLNSSSWSSHVGCTMDLDKLDSQLLRPHHKQSFHLFLALPGHLSPDYFSFRDVAFITAVSNTFKCSRFVGVCKVALILILKGDRLFYCICYQKRKLIEMRELQTTEVGLIPFKQLMNNFSDLGGSILKIGYTHFPPHIFRTTQRGRKNTSATTMAGIEYNMLVAFSRKLNFTFQMIEVNTSGFYSSYARRLVSRVQQGELDFAVSGFTLSYDFMEFVVFGAYIMHHRYIAVFGKDHTRLPDNLE
nr:unnamed protein product [Callosobruchus analis]